MSDVEQRARELLAAEYERGACYDTAERIRRHDPLPAGWQDDCIAIRAIIAALSAPKQVGVVPEAPSKCRECGSSSLSWFAANRNRTQVTEGRLRTGDVECIFVLGCDQCSETLFTISADAAANLLTTPQAAPVPVEGEGFVFDEKLSAILAKLRTANDDDKPAIVREAIERLRGQNRDGPPPSQPAVELEEIRSLARHWRIQDSQIGQGSAGNKARRKCSDELIALLDGAKAGKGEGHE